MTELKFPTDLYPSGEILIAEASQTLQQAYLLAKNQKENKVYPIEFANKVLEEAWQTAEPLVLAIEEKDPGNMGGINKVTEMKELASGSDKLCDELHVEVIERPLVKIVLGTHDLGRHVEKFLSLHPLRAGIRHGALSLLFLDKNNLLDGLTPQDKYVVLFSVFYHAEKDVPVPGGGSQDFEMTAYRICYILRDLDKEHDLGGAKYFEPQGILNQLKAHYLTPAQADLISSNPELGMAIEALIEGLMKGQPNDSFKKIPSDISDEIKRIMTGDVDKQILQSFENKQLAQIQLLKHSWASYLAVRLAMLFDVKNRVILERILVNDRKRIDDSISFIRKRDKNAADLILKSLKDSFGGLVN